MATSYELDNARRTLMYELRTPPQRVGTTPITPPMNGQGKIPFLLPWSRLELGEEEFLETNPHAGFNGAADDHEDIHAQPGWGIVIGVEYRSLSGAFPEAPQGTLDQFAVHEFGWV